MSDTPKASEQIQGLIQMETDTLASLARCAEQEKMLREKLVAIRNQLNGCKLGQQLAEEIAAQS